MYTSHVHLTLHLLKSWCLHMTKYSMVIFTIDNSHLEKKNRPPHFNFHDHNYFQTSVKLTLDEEMAWLITLGKHRIFLIETWITRRRILLSKMLSNISWAHNKEKILSVCQWVRSHSFVLWCGMVWGQLLREDFFLEFRIFCEWFQQWKRSLIWAWYFIICMNATCMYCNVICSVYFL